jgi:hypothetical protein
MHKEAHIEALHYATQRAARRAVIEVLDQWTRGELELWNRRPDGALELVPRHLRCSRFMMLHAHTGQFVPAPWQGQAPPADLRLYGEITVCPVERREPPEQVGGKPATLLPESEPEASADPSEPAIADGVVETAESSNTGAVPPKMPSDADLDSCIKASAAGSKDGKTSGRQLRIDAPSWFAKNHIRPVTQADMEDRLLHENNAALRRGTGKRRG